MSSLNPPNLKPLQEMFLGLMRSVEERAESCSSDYDFEASPTSKRPTKNGSRRASVFEGDVVPLRSSKKASKKTDAPSSATAEVDDSPRSKKKNHVTVPPPLGAQILQEVGKGWYTTKYVHLRLDHWGVPPLLEDTPTSIGLLKKKLLGMPCSYLLMGTTTIVAGTIVGVSKSKSNAPCELSNMQVEVVPFKGMGGIAAWVSLEDVFSVPADMTTLKNVVHAEVHTILKGGGTTAPSVAEEEAVDDEELIF